MRTNKKTAEKHMEEKSVAEKAAEIEKAIEKTADEKVPLKKTKAGKAAAKEDAERRAPAEKAPVEKAPVEKAPVERAPVERAPVEKAPVEKALVEETASKKAAVNKTMSQDLTFSDDITEEAFLKNYRPGDYERPSVTTDILVFTLSERGELSLLLIQRGGHPFKDCWALPGGFVNMEESLDEAARRELFEETNLTDIYMEQLATFGEVNRDPRMRVISVAYMGLAPKGSLLKRCCSGDDAKAVCLFQIKQRANGTFVFLNEERVIMFSESELAFDHAKIIHEGVNRIRGKLNYTDIAFELLESKEMFTMADLRVAYEAITGVPYPASNFTRNITTRYIRSGKMVEMRERVMAGNGMKVALYEYHKDGSPNANAKSHASFEEVHNVKAGVKDGNIYGFGAASKARKRRDKAKGKAEENRSAETIESSAKTCEVRQPAARTKKRKKQDSPVSASKGAEVRPSATRAKKRKHPEA